MNKVLPAHPPSWFWVVALFLLVWNGFGVFSFFGQMGMSAADMRAAYSEAEIALFEATPAWVNGAFAVAVFAGLTGAIGLLLRKGWARALFLLSLVAVLVQHFWSFFITGWLEVLGGERLVLPAAVIVIAIFEVWLANRGRERGWLR